MTTPTPPPLRYAASSVHALLDLLDDPVLLLRCDGMLAFVNRAAARLLDCAGGWPVERLAPRIGADLAAWLRALPLAGSGFAARPGLRLGGGSTPAPDAQLAGGRSARVAVQRIDGGCWAITLRLRAEPAPATADVPRGDAEALRLLWESPLPAMLHDRRYRLISVNDAALALSGHTREALIGTDPIELLDPAERAPYEADRRACAERVAAGLPPGTPPAPIESRIVDLAGRERWFRVSHRRLNGDGGEALCLIVFEDCTAEHEVRRLDEWFDRSPAGMVLFDGDGSVVRANPAFAALVGPLPRRLADAPEAVRRLLSWPPDGAPAALPAGPGAVECEVWLPQPDGSSRRLRAVVHGHRTGRGRDGRFAMVEDRSAEDERDLARLQVGVLTGSAGVGLAMFQESAGWLPPVDGGGGAAAAAALPQAIGRHLVAADSLPAFEDVQLALRQGRRAEARYEIRHPELGPRWLLTRVEPARLASGQRTMSVITLDITEAHQAQRRNEQLLHELSTILESTTAGIAYVRGSVLMRCNRRFEQMLGLAPGQGVGRSVAALLAGQPRAQDVVRDTLCALNTVNVYETEFEGHPGLGTAQRPRWFTLSVRRTDASAPPGPAGARTGVEAIAVLSDVTRLKTQQRELETLARDRELMFSLSEVGIAFVRGERIQRANQALAALLGCAVEALANLAHRELYADHEAFEAQRALEHEALLGHGRWSGERRMRRSDGGLLWVQVSERLVVDGRLDGGMIVSYVDVDARFRAERSLALQAERTRAILDSVLVGIVTAGASGIEWMNRSAQRMFGATLADFVGQAMSTVATPEADHPFRRTRYLDELVEGQAETFECRVQARDGRAFWVVGNVVATGRESTGRQLTYALLDIERRRAAEARIAETQDELQRLIEIAPLAITLHDARTQRVVHLNQMAASVIGRTVDEAIGCAPEDLHPPELAAAMRADMQAALAEGGELRRDYVFRIDGAARTWDARYRPMGPDGAAPTQLLLVATDVTEQRAAQEARYAAAVAQREMLVKEVHHRIKNNLQGVAGLLQEIAVRRPEVAPAINEAVGQMQAIAQVYGLQVGAAGPLALAGVVEAVTRSVQRIFGRPIALTIDCAEAHWLLPEAESIPIALSVNELLTNAIKHSRTAASAPEGSADAPGSGVSCSVRADAAGAWVAIGNDGRLPEGFSLARFPGGVSGLGLVRALLPRRSSRFDLEQQGTRVAASLHLTPPGIVRAPDA